MNGFFAIQKEKKSFNTTPSLFSMTTTDVVKTLTYIKFIKIISLTCLNLKEFIALNLLRLNKFTTSIKYHYYTLTHVEVGKKSPPV